MTSLAFAGIPGRLRPFATLIERQPLLARYGLALIVLAGAAVLMQEVDGRVLEGGDGIWVKPAKFFFSVGLFALTMTWLFGYVRPERRRSLAMTATAATLVAAGTVELLYISLQAARGLESHFNISTPFHMAMYAVMGLGAVLLVGTTLPLAWEIARRPAHGLRADFVAAVVIGLLLTFLLGGGLGGYMSSQIGHSVGAQGGQVPLFGWNRSGGDLRIAHFLGIHAQQAIPLGAALIAAAATRTRWLLLAAGSAAYVAITLALFAQAVAGRPLLPL